MLKQIAEVEITEWDMNGILDEFINLFSDKGYTVILTDDRANPRLMIAKEQSEIDYN